MGWLHDHCFPALRWFFGYWLRVLRRALWDAWQSLGHSPKKLIFGPLTTLLAFFVFGWMAGTNQVFAKAEWWLAVVGAGAVFFVLVFLFFLLIAPARMEEEARKATAEREADLNERCAKLQSQSDEILAALRELKNREADEEQRKRQAVRRELERLLKDGDYFEGLCNEPMRTPPRREVKEWINKVEGILREKMGLAAVVRFQSNAELSTDMDPGLSPQLVLLSTLGKRMGNLRELLWELSRGS